MPGGRPSLYDPEEHPKAVRLLMGNGKTLADVAEHFDVNRSTITEWIKNHAEFSAAIDLGREDATDRVERALFERATGYSWPSEKLMTVSDGGGGGSHVERHKITEHVPPDPAALKFFLSNRRRKEWAERQQIEGGDGGPLVVKVIRSATAPGTLPPQTMGEPDGG
jgi:transposase-like protein